jgi:hypothetical protein
MKKYSLFVAMLLVASALHAQPSEAQIKKDVGGRLPNKIAFSFGKPGFTRRNITNNMTEWLREVIITMPYDPLPQLTKVQYAYAVYEKPTPDIFRFYKLLNTVQHIKGIKDPSETEVMAMIQKDPASFYGHYFNNMVKLIEKPHTPDIAYQRWHTVNSVEIFYKVKFEHITSDVETETRDQVISIRLYRDDTDKPWNRFYAQMIASDENVVYDTKKYTPQQINKMREKTIGQQMLEQAAIKSNTGLPSVSVPAFKNLLEMTIFIHDILRSGNPSALEAVLLQVLSADHFEPGSKSRLNDKGKELVQKAAATAYSGDGTYAIMYCKNAGIEKRSTAGRVYITGCIHNVVTMLAGSQVNGGYKEGKAVKEWKLNELSVGTRQDDDALAYINSFSDRKKLCPAD